MRKYLVGSTVALMVALTTSCGSPNDQPPPPASSVSETVPLEKELRGALGQTLFDAKHVVFQPADKALTFKVGTCDGAVVKVSDPSGEVSRFGVSIMQGQATILKIGFASSDKIVVDMTQRKTVTEECGK